MSRNSFMVFGSLMLVFGMMLGGCSRLSQNEDSGQGGLGINCPSPSTEVTPPPFQYDPYVYPEAANQPPPGYRLINIGAGIGEDGLSICDGDNDFTIWNLPDTAWAGKFVQYHQDQHIKLKKNELHLESNAVPYGAWITMTKPTSANPWINFEPHGMVFDQPQHVDVTFYYNPAWFPGVNPATLEIWYWNQEQNVYEFIGGNNHVDEHKIEFKLDHFSRYVVASQL